MRITALVCLLLTSLSGCGSVESLEPVSRHHAPILGGELASAEFGAVGALGYFSELEVYDTFGLVSPEVLQHGTTVANASPGHDFSVPVQFFFPRHPTYLGSVMSRVDSRQAKTLLEFWEQHPWHDWAELERHPLSVEQGFRPGSELWLLRLTRWE